jgi:hypothetical protein
LSTLVIHVLRPYANEEEYLANERFSIDAKSMLLIDQSPLPLETPIIFDVQLENGQKPIRAEAKVIGYVEPGADKPGGLRVRFKRFGAATKAFIDRATAASAAATRPGPEPIAGRVSVLPAPSLVPSASVPAPVAPEPAALSFPAADRGEPSGIHRRVVLPVAAPANREELLERLRARARSVARQSDANPGEQTG